MNILILPSFYPDPINKNLGSFFKEQVKCLANLGVKVSVVYVEQRSLHHLTIKNIFKFHFQTEIVHEVNCKEYRINGWKIPGIIGRKIWLRQSENLIIKYILKQEKPDLIHAHNVLWAGVVANNIYKEFNIPYVITEHDSAFLIGSLSTKRIKVSRQVYLNASNIIAVSKTLQKNINQIVPSKKIAIVPNIVNTDFFKPLENTKSNNNITKFISIGNLNRNKGHELQIEAMNNVLQLNKNVTLVICGDGPEKENLKKKISDLHLMKNVILTGYQNKSQILEHLQNADCLLHTSYFETFGVVLIEALACGVPFIATKCGGPEDIFEKGVGSLIEKGNAKILTNELLKFIENKVQYSASRIRTIAINKYSKHIISEKLIQIYSNIIEKNRSNNNDKINE